MQFYTYQYIKNQSSLNIYLRYILAGIILLFLFIFIVKYFRHRLVSKYRNLIIILLLGIVLLFGIQFSDYSQSKLTHDQSDQMTGFLKVIAQDQAVTANKLAVNSMSLSDGMVLKIDKTYYQINFNTDFSSYQLTETHLVNPAKITINN